MIDRRVDFSQSGKLWIVLADLVIILYVVWQLSNSIAAGSFRPVLLLGAAFAAFFIGGKIANDWRSGVYFFFVWLLFEDLIRKYTGNNMYVYFGKDVLIGVTYLSLLAERTRRNTVLFPAPFKFGLGMFFLLVLAQVFNPLSPSIFFGLLGLKLYFYYIPLMFVGYAMLRTVSDLRRFLVLSMVLASVVSVVGILQTVIGMDFLNPRGMSDIDELGHGVRATSTGLVVARPPGVFVSDGRFEGYLLIVFILGLGAAGFLLLRSFRGRKVVFPAVGLVAVALIVAGGRTAFVLAAASALVLPAGMIWGSPPRLGEGYRLLKAIRRAFVFVALALGLGVMIFPGSVGAHLAYYRETLMPGSEQSQTADRTWTYPAQQLMYAFDDPAWAMGHGTGTASLGTQYVSRILDVHASLPVVENGFGTLILEVGILGPILWLIWATSLVWACIKVALRLKGTWAFPLALSITWFAFLQILPMTWGSMAAYQNFVGNAYLWLAVGFLFRLPGLVAEEQFNSAASQ
jgi:hypothetical protein